ncbi:MAG: TIM barrel protein [Isosphaeraceae bacterium]
MYSSFNARAVGLDLPPDIAIDLAASHGFGGVDLMVRDLVDRGYDPRALRARMDHVGLRGGAWPLSIAWRDTAEPAFRRDLIGLDRYAEAASILGLMRTGTWVEPEAPLIGDLGPELSLDIAFDRHLSRLGAIARVLDRHGIRLGLEVIGVESFRPGHGPAFIARLGEPRLRQLLDCLAQSGPEVGLLLDLWHLYASGEAWEDVQGLVRGVGRIVWVHVADLPAGARPDRGQMIDSLRGLPGDHGAIDCRFILECLSREGFDGPVTAEPLAVHPDWAGLPPDEVVSRISRAMDRVWPAPAPQ